MHLDGTWETERTCDRTPKVAQGKVAAMAEFILPHVVHLANRYAIYVSI